MKIAVVVGLAVVVSLVYLAFRKGEGDDKDK